LTTGGRSILHPNIAPARILWGTFFSQSFEIYQLVVKRVNFFGSVFKTIEYLHNMQPENSNALNFKPLGRGNSVTPELVALILRLFAHLKLENENDPTVSTYSPESRLLAYTGLSKGLVTRILAEYHRCGQIPRVDLQKRGRKPSDCPKYVWREDLIYIRRVVNQLNLSGEAVTIAKLENLVSQKMQKQLSQRQLKYILKDKLGYEWHRANKHNAAKYTPQMEAWIYHFIKRKQQNRASANPLLEVYVDESYVNEYHSANYSWFETADAKHLHLVGSPSSKGRRIIMMDAGCANGWIDNVTQRWYANYKF